MDLLSNTETWTFCPNIPSLAHGFYNGSHICNARLYPHLLMDFTMHHTYAMPDSTCSVIAEILGQDFMDAVPFHVTELWSLPLHPGWYNLRTPHKTFNHSAFKCERLQQLFHGHYCCVGSLGGSPPVPNPYQVMLVHTYSNQFISVSACWANSLRFVGLSIHAIKDGNQFTINQCTISIDQTSKGSHGQLPWVCSSHAIYSPVWVPVWVLMHPEDAFPGVAKRDPVAQTGVKCHQGQVACVTLKVVPVLEESTNR